MFSSIKAILDSHTMFSLLFLVVVFGNTAFFVSFEVRDISLRLVFRLHLDVFLTTDLLGECAILTIGTM